MKASFTPEEAKTVSLLVGLISRTIITIGRAIRTDNIASFGNASNAIEEDVTDTLPKIRIK